MLVVDVFDLCFALGMPEDNALIEKLYALFTDLTRDELASGVFLVCRVYR